MTAGAFTDRRAAVLPVLCAIGGILAPAAIYLALNRGPTAPGWSAPTSTGIAFTLGILALLGGRAPTGLKVFVAALAVVDDILSMLILAIFYPQDFHARLARRQRSARSALMFALNRWRVYAGWPYLVATLALWLSLHAAGVNAALAGVVLAAFLPTRPAPAAGPLAGPGRHGPGRARARPDRGARRRRRRNGGAAGADLGLGQPQPLGRQRAAALAGRAGRARRRPVVGLCGAAAVRLHRHRRSAGRRSGRAQAPRTCSPASSWDWWSASRWGSAWRRWRR